MSGKLDSEGLLEHYDVVLCGTGLVQSIVASAVARCKKTVLHADGVDHYGGLEAVWTLPYLLSLKSQPLTTVVLDPSTTPLVSLEESDESILKLHPQGPMQGLRFHAIERQTNFAVRVGSTVQTSYGKGKIIEALMSACECSQTIVILLTGWKLANGTFPKLYAGEVPLRLDSNDPIIDHDCSINIDSSLLWQNHGIRTIASAAAHAILNCQSRSLAIDVTPYLLYASGPAVDGLLISSVSDYVEFKSLEGLLFAERRSADETITISRVPCSKNDVFASKLLSHMDKFRLMKLLQTVADYATAEASNAELEKQVAPTDQAVFEDVQHWNDRHLKQGRSLQRPQNKAVASSDLQLLQSFCHAPVQISLENYLREHQKLPETLSNMVRYALALETADQGDATTTATGIQQLCAHMMALGRFGGTAFLVPLYGSGELAQAFCRSAAVYGATYLLRREPVGVVLDKSTLEAGEATTDSPRVHHVILNGPSSSLEDASSDSTTLGVKRISCTHVVLPDGALYSNQPGTSSQRVLRRISVLFGKPLQFERDVSNRQQRHVIILPPCTVSDRQTSTIHALFLDEAVNVAPHIPGGCTVAHFTMTIKVHEESDEQLWDEILKSALDNILDHCRLSAGNRSEESTFDEVFHASFSYDLWSSERSSDVEGLHVTHRPRPGLSADEAFDQAASIFAKVCPGQDFLKLSQEMGDAVRASLGDHALDEEDEEKLVLESAVADL